MSKVILRAKRFLNLLLTTSSNQQQALLHTATPDQVFAICEIFYNLQHMKLSPKVNTLIKRRRRLMTQLINKQYSTHRKSVIISTNRKQILDILQLVAKKLFQVLA